MEGSPQYVSDDCDVEWSTDRSVGCSTVLAVEFSVKRSVELFSDCWIERLLLDFIGRSMGHSSGRSTPDVFAT